MHQPLPQAVNTAHFVIEAIKAAGIDESDPDFITLVESECGALERLRRMLRAARWAESQAKAVKDMEAEMRERRARFEAKADTLRTIVRQAMTALDMKKLEAPDLTASLAAGRPGVVIEDEDAIPSQLCKVVKSPDRPRSGRRLSRARLCLAPRCRILLRL